jgi:hypothetical protein
VHDRFVRLGYLALMFVSHLITFCKYIIACRAVSRQRLGKHVPAATDRHATIEVLLEMGFSTRLVPRGYKEANWGNQVSSVG